MQSAFLYQLVHNRVTFSYKYEIFSFSKLAYKKFNAFILSSKWSALWWSLNWKGLSFLPCQMEKRADAEQWFCHLISPSSPVSNQVNKMEMGWVSPIVRVWCYPILQFDFSCWILYFLSHWHMTSYRQGITGRGIRIWTSRQPRKTTVHSHTC